MTTGLTGKSTRRPSERIYVEHGVDSLLPHPLNEKLYGHLAADEKFVESIKEFGVLEPILTARMSFNDGESYEDYVISGHRRWFAAKTLGFKGIPTRDLSAFGARQNRSDNPEALLELEKTLIESNRQRIKTESQKDAEAAALLRIEKELAAKRQQAGVRQNLAEGGKAVEKVAEVTGESPETVRKRVEIHDAKLPPEERNNKSTHAAFLEIQNEKRRRKFRKANPDFTDKSDAEVDAAIKAKYGDAPAQLKKHQVSPVPQGGSSVSSTTENPSAGDGSNPIDPLQDSITPADAVLQIVKFMDGLISRMTQADKDIVYESLKAHVEDKFAVTV